MKRSLIFLGCLLSLWVGLPLALGAEPTYAPTVTGSGSVEIKRQPEILRVQIEIMTRGKTLKEAIDKLKTRREEVKIALDKLGATKEAIRFEDTAPANEAAGRQAQVDRFIRDRNGALGKPKPKSDPPSIVSVNVRADFPIAAADSDAFLIVVRDLREKIKTADLGGLKDKGKLTPEEEEAAEEAAGNTNNRGGDSEGSRGDPVFLFVSKVSEKERAKALAEAFEKAKRDANRLARAAGAELGGLHRLADQFQPGFDSDEPFGRRGGYYPGRTLGEGVEEGEEAIGVQIAKVSLRIGVVAHFKLKPGEK